MYRPQLDKRDKGGALAAVIAVHAGLLFAFLNITGRMDIADPQSALRMFDIDELLPPPPPPPPPPPQQRVEQARPKQKEGGSAPKNIRSEATPVVAPKPIVVVPPVPQIATSETPREGTAPTQGASDVPGPGTGGGGVGNGSGSGSGGNGPGGGGGGGGAPAPVSLVRGISTRDYPPGVRQNWPRGGAIFLRLRIEPDGRPSRCDVMRGFGNDSIDQWTCSLITQRGVFRPARDARGNPIAAWFGYKQVDIGR
jgi:protein TonB